MSTQRNPRLQRRKYKLHADRTQGQAVQLSSSNSSSCIIVRQEEASKQNEREYYKPRFLEWIYCKWENKFEVRFYTNEIYFSHLKCDAIDKGSKKSSLSAKWNLAHEVEHFKKCDFVKYIYYATNDELIIMQWHFFIKKYYFIHFL